MKFKHLFAAALACTAFYAAAQDTAKDLSPLQQANKWTLERNAVKAANSTVDINGESASALKLTYTISHKQADGSLKPGGWPYAHYVKLPAGLNDWSTGNALKLKINAQISRADAENLSFIIAIIPAKGKRVDTTVKLTPGKWIDCVIPMDKFENTQKIKDIKFFLDGSKYKHDDVLTVEIAKMQLEQ